MRRVTLHINENDYKLFHYYCANYCRLYDETRKNSIKILLELYKDDVIDIRDHSLDNLFTFFYQKTQEFEAEGLMPASDADNLMRIRICSDIIAFLEDLEKLYRIIRKKNSRANYILIFAVFSQEIDDAETRTLQEDLIEAASAEIYAIVSPLGYSIEKKLGHEIDTQTLLYELVSFTETFNRLSPDITFNDEIIDLIAPLLIRWFEIEENAEEIRTLLTYSREQFEIGEFESALEGNPHDQTGLGLEFSWEDLLEPLSFLNELIALNQRPPRRLPDVLSALESPLKEKTAPAEYSQLTLTQKPRSIAKRRNEGNRILITVDNRSRSTVQPLPVLGLAGQATLQEQKYQQYFSVSAGVMVILAILLASVILSFSSAPEFAVGNTTGGLTAAKNGTISSLVATIPTSDVPITIIGNEPTQIAISPPLPIPTPIQARQYVTIESVTHESDDGPKSSRELYEQPDSILNGLYNTDDYITIFNNNIPYNETHYKISFDLKNPPMIIHFTVVPQNITDIKWFTPRDAEKTIDTAIVDRPDELAWFELTVSDKDGLHDTQGWGGIYGSPSTAQEVIIRNPGMYQIEFSGRLVKVNSEVLVKQEGNIEP